jgi:hypothetical protein
MDRYFTPVMISFHFPLLIYDHLEFIPEPEKERDSEAAVDPLSCLLRPGPELNSSRVAPRREKHCEKDNRLSPAPTNFQYTLDFGFGVERAGVVSIL